HYVHPGHRGQFAFALNPLPPGGHRLRFDLTLDCGQRTESLGEVSVMVRSSPRPSLFRRACKVALTTARAGKAALKRRLLRQTAPVGQPGAASGVALLDTPPAMPERQEGPKYGAAYRTHNVSAVAAAAVGLAVDLATGRYRGGHARQLVEQGWQPVVGWLL